MRTYKIVSVILEDASVRASCGEEICCGDLEFGKAERRNRISYFANFLTSNLKSEKCLLTINLKTTPYTRISKINPTIDQQSENIYQTLQRRSTKLLHD